MDLTHYLSGLTRRWKVIVAAVVVAVVVGWVLSPEQAASGPTTTSYKGTTYLLGTSSSSVGLHGSSSLQTIAQLATLDEVTGRVADAIHYDGDPAALASTVQVTPNDTTGFLTIAATAPTAARAKLVADSYAEKLLEFLRERTLGKADALRNQIHRVDRQIAALSDQASETSGSSATPAPGTGGKGGGGGGSGGTTTDAQLADLQLQRQLLQQQLTQLSTDAGSNLAGLEIVQPATAARVGAASSSGGIQAPQSRAIRLLIAVAIGLLLGLALALLLERFDTRIRSKEAAEEAYGVPVLAVVPRIGRRGRADVVKEPAPRGPAANAFRLLAAAVQMGPSDGIVHVEGNGRGGWPRTILVTSGEPREGTSTVAAHLAAAFAEMGKRVIVACCDYRHPTLHATFGVDAEPGLTDALENDHAMPLDAFVQETALQRVSVLAPGRLPSTTFGLFGSQRMREVITGLGTLADVVVIDTAPVLATSDWTQLLTIVDAVLVVARVGRTDAGSARRVSDVLQLLRAPLSGVVLNDMPRGLRRKAADRSWYRYHEPARRERETPRDAVPVGQVPSLPDGNGESPPPAEEVSSAARPGMEKG